MISRTHLLLSGLLLTATAPHAVAQDAPPVAAPLTPAAAAAAPAAAPADPDTASGATPPIQPHLQDVPLPAAVVLPPPPDGIAIPQRPLTADEAARIALQRQPNITIAAAGVAAAQGRRQQVQSASRPQLNATAGYTNFTSIGGGQTSTGGSLGSTTGTTTTTGSGVNTVPYVGGLTLSQLLFDFNRTRDLVRQASAQQRAAGANLSRAQSDLVLQVKQGFYTYLQDVRLISVAESDLHSRQDALALARARVNVGVGLPLDEVTALTAVAEAVQTLDQARNTASIASTTLALAMGIDPRTPIQTAETGEPVAVAGGLDALVNQGLRRRPEILEAQANVEAAGYGVSAARHTNLPAVTADVGVTTRGTTFPPRNNGLSLGLGLQWNLFNGGLTQGLVTQANAAAQSAQATLAGARLSVISDVSQAYLNLATAQQRVPTTDAEVANASESLRIAEGRYRAGVGTFIDVTNAQAALVTARTNRVNAGSAVDQARAAINHSVGAGVGGR